ncbi:MAG: hypothetical protein PHN56_03600 [Candidatus Nanoarchaeia archaeon]|nr:hypothetical protein [Candidatus Nanoarchaeia archaeon]
MGSLLEELMAYNPNFIKECEKEEKIIADLKEKNMSVYDKKEFIRDYQVRHLDGVGALHSVSKEELCDVLGLNNDELALLQAYHHNNYFAYANKQMVKHKLKQENYGFIDINKYAKRCSVTPEDLEKKVVDIFYQRVKANNPISGNVAFTFNLEVGCNKELLVDYANAKYKNYEDIKKNPKYYAQLHVNLDSFLSSFSSPPRIDSTAGFQHALLGKANGKDSAKYEMDLCEDFKLGRLSFEEAAESLRENFHVFFFEY